MKRFLIAVGALALTATPSFAHEHRSADAPKCEHMKDGKMKCCKKDKDGKMVCKMMDHGKPKDDKQAGHDPSSSHGDHKPE